MRGLFRRLFDRLFTGMAGLSILLMAAALVIILGPMLWRGSGAVAFRATFEWRRLQFYDPLFRRGEREAIEAEAAEIAAARRPVYDLLDRFGRGLDPSAQRKHARHTYRELKRQLRNRVADERMTEAEQDRLIDEGKRLRDALVAAYETADEDEALRHLETILTYEDRAAFAGTLGESLFRLAAEYREVVRDVDLARRAEYAEAYVEVKEIIERMFGPRPGERPKADMPQYRYGVTRWDQAQDLLDELFYRELWVAPAGGKTRVKVRRSRAETFEGTSLAGLFPLMRENYASMLHPRWTLYWQYFIDDCPAGHYFGGLGPEILGTLLLTLLAMLLAVPTGIIAAAYLVECARETLFVRVIRTCINTLAGVPSIVFGLFGLAFFLGWLPDLLERSFGSSVLSKESNIFAGAMTLGLLVLPIMIRASEEAIRAVPTTYKEASLALGASGFRTFMVVTLPAGLPGILTGIILSMSRAAGETAPILFTAAVAFRMGLPDSVFEGGTRALSYSSYDIAVGDRTAMDFPHKQYGMISTLILLVLIMNIAAILLRSRVARKLRGQ